MEHTHLPEDGYLGHERVVNTRAGRVEGASVVRLVEFGT